MLIKGINTRYRKFSNPFLREIIVFTLQNQMVAPYLKDENKVPFWRGNKV